MTKEIAIGTFLIFLAIFLDATQVLVGLGISSITSIAAVIPVVGQGISAIGFTFGAVVDVCLSFSFGSFLIMLLVYFKMFYPKYIFGGSGLEMLPFLDIFPGWTAMTVACVWRKNFGKSGIGPALAAGGVFAVAGAAVSTINKEGGGKPRKNGLASGQTASASAKQSVRNIELGNLDGIRAPKQKYAV